jgi:hypothetical protein
MHFAEVVEDPQIAVSEPTPGRILRASPASRRDAAAAERSADGRRSPQMSVSGCFSVAGSGWWR